MTRQLTPIEIEKLFAFVRSKYVRWVDLQYEIVDHLATAIEDTITEDPTISFDRALQQVYSSFPITGFTNLVAAKQKALHRYWIRKYFSIMKSYFQLPKILITLLLAYCIYLSFILFGQYGLAAVAVLILSGMIISLIHKKRNGHFSKQLSEKYLFTSTFLGISAGVTFGVFQLPLQIGSDLIFHNQLNQPKLIIISILFALIAIWTHAEIYYFPRMLEEEINNKYKHLNISLG